MKHLWSKMLKQKNFNDHNNNDDDKHGNIKKCKTKTRAVSQLECKTLEKKISQVNKTDEQYNNNYFIATITLYNTPQQDNNKNMMA